LYAKIIKRVLDTILAIIGVTVALIPMIFIAIAIKSDSSGPVFFKQEREGKHHRKFNIYKFRTMCVGAYEMGGIATSEKDSRITKVGAFLRRTSLDEIPQFFNILKGDMAIIGPRPVLDWEYKEYSNKKYESRFDVRSGMFCTVDLDYRATADRNMQFQMDADYAKNITFVGDVKIFFGIIKTVVLGKNVYRDEGDTENVR